MCEYFSLKVFSKNVKSECKILKSVISFSSKQSLRKTFIRCSCKFFKDCCFFFYFWTDCFELSQFVNFHLLLQNIFELYFMVRSSVFLKFSYGFLDKQNLLDSDSAT